MKAKKVDSNQAEIVAALRNAGYFVYCQHRHGAGLPDLLVCSKSRIAVQMEIKMPGETFTPAEAKFWNNYPGDKAMVCTIEQAIKTMEGYDDCEVVVKDE